MPQVTQPADNRAGSCGLAGVHAGARQCDDRHAMGIEGGIVVEWLAPARAGTPMRSPRYGKCSTVPSTSQSNGGPTSGLAESQMPSTPPILRSWIVSPGVSDVRQVTGVTAQCLAMAERADDDVALVDRCHAARRQFELVVARLVVHDAHSDEHAFLAGNVGGHAQLRDRDCCAARPRRSCRR